MAENGKQRENPQVFTWRPNPDDWKIIAALRKRLGVKPAEILRIAIRSLAEEQKVKVRL